MSSKEEMRSGACLCGAVRMTVKPNGTKVGACHCGMCRKWSGGPLLAIDTDSDVAIEGEDALTVFQSSDWAERGFCSRCGTHLFYRLRQGLHYALPVGLFDDGDWVFAEQIFIDEKPTYYDFANATENMTGPEVFAKFAPPQ